MTRIIAVIPAYREESRIAAAVSDALTVCTAAVVVDDCSPDNTGLRAKEAGAVVVRHPINRGQGAALQTGMTYALSRLSPDIIVHFDGDGQMQASDIPDLIAPLVSGEADVVLGSRFLGKAAQDMPMSRKALLMAARIFTLCISGIYLTDAHNGFRAMTAKAAGSIRITLDRMAHASELLDVMMAKRLRVCERPVTIRYSQETLQKGQSAWGALRIVKDLSKKRFFG